MRECLPSFNNIQQRILSALDVDLLEYPNGVKWDKEDGHLKKLIERGFVIELPDDNFIIATDLYGEPLYNQTQWVGD